MSSGRPYDAVAFLIIAGIAIAGHGWWCLSRGIYRGGRVRVVHAESPIEFWIWIGFELFFATFMIAGGIVLLLLPVPT